MNRIVRRATVTKLLTDWPSSPFVHRIFSPEMLPIKYTCSLVHLFNFIMRWPGHNHRTSHSVHSNEPGSIDVFLSLVCRISRSGYNTEYSNASMIPLGLLKSESSAEDMEVRPWDGRRDSVGQCRTVYPQGLSLSPSRFHFTSEGTELSKALCLYRLQATSTSNEIHSSF